MWQGVLVNRTKTGKETLPAYWPSVPLCVHSNCTELHYLQRVREVALCSRAVTRPCEKIHVKTNKSGILYMGGGRRVVSGGSKTSWRD